MTASGRFRRGRWADWELEELLRAFPITGRAPEAEALAQAAQDIGRSTLAIRRMWITVEAQLSGQRPMASLCLRQFVRRRLAPERTYLGIIPVDVGAILLSDPSYVLARDGIDGEDYNEFLAALDAGRDWMADGFAMIVWTDDAIHPVYGEFDEGRLTKVVIDLNPPDELAAAYWRENRETVRAARHHGALGPEGAST